MRADLRSDIGPTAFTHIHTTTWILFGSEFLKDLFWSIDLFGKGLK